MTETSVETYRGYSIRKYVPGGGCDWAYAYVSGGPSVYYDPYATKDPFFDLWGLLHHGYQRITLATAVRDLRKLIDDDIARSERRRIIEEAQQEGLTHEDQDLAILEAARRDVEGICT